jgi:hypothetical protein
MMAKVRRRATSAWKAVMIQNLQRVSQQKYRGGIRPGSQVSGTRRQCKRQNIG